MWSKPHVPCRHRIASVTGVPPFLISETLLTTFLEMLPLGNPGMAGLPVPAGRGRERLSEPLGRRVRLGTVMGFLSAQCVLTRGFKPEAEFSLLFLEFIKDEQVCIAN